MAGIFIYRWQKGWVIWAKVTQLLSSRIGIRPGSIQATCSTLCCDDVNKEETPGTGFKTPVLYTSTKLASSLLLLGNCWGYVLGVASTFSIHSMAETHMHSPVYFAALDEMLIAVVIFISEFNTLSFLSYFVQWEAAPLPLFPWTIRIPKHDTYLKWYVNTWLFLPQSGKKIA